MEAGRSRPRPIAPQPPPNTMSNTPDNPPAFPFVEPPTECNVNTGMTLRDYFAAAALSSMAASEDEYGTTRSVEDRAEWSFEQADAMLAARNFTRIRKVCRTCGGSGITPGWQPTYSDPANEGGHPEAEPCMDCDVWEQREILEALENLSSYVDTSSGGEGGWPRNAPDVADRLLKRIAARNNQPVTSHE